MDDKPTPLRLQLLGALVVPVTVVASAWAISSGYGLHLVGVAGVLFLLALIASIPS